MSNLYSLCILKHTFQLLRYIFPHTNYLSISLTSIQSMNSLWYTLTGNSRNLKLPSCLLGHPLVRIQDGYTNVLWVLYQICSKILILLEWYENGPLEIQAWYGYKAVRVQGMFHGGGGLSLIWQSNRPWHVKQLSLIYCHHLQRDLVNYCFWERLSKNRRRK